MGRKREGLGSAGLKITKNRLVGSAGLGDERETSGAEARKTARESRLPRGKVLYRQYWKYYMYSESDHEIIVVEMEALLVDHYHIRFTVYGSLINTVCRYFEARGYDDRKFQLFSIAPQSHSGKGTCM